MFWGDCGKARRSTDSSSFEGVGTQPTPFYIAIFLTHLVFGCILTVIVLSTLKTLHWVWQRELPQKTAIRPTLDNPVGSNLSTETPRTLCAPIGSSANPCKDSRKDQSHDWSFTSSGIDESSRSGTVTRYRSFDAALGCTKDRSHTPILIFFLLT